MDEISENNFDLFGQFTRIEWLLHRYHQHNHKIHGPMSDPHRGQGRVLALLKMQPEISQRDLSYLLDMRPQSLGELLAKLERSGYITRTPSEADRRVINIRLTGEGAQTVEQQSGFDELFDCLEKEEQTVLSGYLNRIITLLEQQLGNDQSEPDFDRYGYAHADPPHDEHFYGHHGMEHERPPRDGRFWQRGGGAEHGRSPHDDGRFGRHDMEHDRPPYDGHFGKEPKYNYTKNESDGE